MNRLSPTHPTAPGLSMRSAASRHQGVISTTPDSQAEFAAVLGRQTSGHTALSSAHEAARTAAEEFVAVALVQPILAQARESSGAAPPFDQSSSIKQLGALQDAALAQRVTKAAHFPLVDRLAQDLTRGVASSSAGTPA